MAKSQPVKSLESKRRRAGYSFVAHWVIGLVLFFAYPLISSIWYTFNTVRIEAGSINLKLVGLENLKKILLEDPNYVNNVRDSLGSIFYSLPVIIALSLILAILLNQKFRGRVVFRTIFFLPVIMSGSVVMKMLKSQYVTMPLFTSGKAGSGIIDYSSIIDSLKMPEFLSTILIFLLGNTISLVCSCGVQTILFLAGLQSIPESLYEVSKIEGANKWEEFWLITVPSLRHIIGLVLIYTMIELFTDANNKVVSDAYSLMVAQNFGESSAMLWFYFVFVIIVIGTIYFAYSRFCEKHWE